MKKTICIGLCVILCAAALSGEAPELQVVMPNSWKKLERVTDSEQIVKTMQPDITKALSYDAGESFFTSCTYSTVYRQATKNAVFYRLVFSNCPVSEISSLNHWFYQALVRQTKKGYRLYGMAVYNYLSASVKGDYDLANFAAIDIIESSGNAKGVLFTLVLCGTTPNQNALQNGTSVKVPYKFYFVTKKQLSGGNSGKYYLIKDLEKKDFTIGGKGKYALYEPQVDTDITITASDCLFDTRCPLKYSIQNAFDGDPATSYVENTDDDLMEIGFTILSPEMKNINLLTLNNGYSKSSELYFANNRIKEFEIASYKLVSQTELGINKPVEFICADKIMKNQSFGFGIKNRVGPLKIRALSTFKGIKFNDTCMAELNLQTKDKKWIFGEEHE
jgi:hypothetical protein